MKSFKIFLGFLLLLSVVACGDDKQSGGAEGEIPPVDNQTGELLSRKQLYDKQQTKRYKSLEDASAAKPEEVYWLELRSKDLTEFPKEVLKFKRLQVLVLSGNKLTKLPPEIGQLGNLQKLELGGNELTGLPAEIGDLRNLEELGLGSNEISSLPDELAYLRENLKDLAILSNGLTEIPTVIYTLKSLEDLNLNSNKITTIPDGINNLENLKELGLMFNQLEEVNPQVGELKSLTRLLLPENKFTELPESIGNLGNLTFLSLHGNNLKSLPGSITKLKKLRDLYLDENLELDMEKLFDQLGQLPNLSSLKIGGKAFGDDKRKIPANITGLEKLRSLNLDYLAFSTEELESLFGHLAKMKSLKAVSFGGDGITSFPASIGNLKVNRFSMVFMDKLTAFPLAGMKQMPNLQYVYYSGDSFTDAQMEQYNQQLGSDVDISF